MVKQLLVAVGLASALSANASLTINYQVDGVPTMLFANSGQPGDKVTIQAFTANSLVLPDNTPVTAKINSLLFEVNYTWPQGQWNFNANRNMSITAPSGGSQVLVQSGVYDSWLQYNPADGVWMLAGNTATFNVPGYGTVAVTPLATPAYTHASIGTYQHDINASFLFTPVPEPSTWVAGVGALGLVASSMSSRKRRSA